MTGRQEGDVGLKVDKRDDRETGGRGRTKGRQEG